MSTPEQRLEAALDHILYKFEQESHKRRIDSLSERHLTTGLLKEKAEAKAAILAAVQQAMAGLERRTKAQTALNVATTIRHSLIKRDLSAIPPKGLRHTTNDELIAIAVEPYVNALHPPTKEAKG
jgi:hypothetical protein